MNWLILSVAIVLNALANILIKVGMRGKTLEIGLVTIMKIITSPAIIGGIIFFVCALIAYGYVLSKMNLSIAYPIMTSMGFLIVILASWLFLKEAIGLGQCAGFILILLGVWLVAR